MSDSPRVFIVAGEPSGDRLGADLVKRLRIRTAVTPVGVGGPELEGEGLRSLFPMRDLAVMGVSDVLLRLPLLYLRMRQTVGAILRLKPDLVILIDSQVFSETVARKARKAGYGGKMLLYVAPAVWGWKPERAPAMRPLYDEVLAVLPFEPAVMKRLGGPATTYVGHATLEQTILRPAQPERGPLLLLPGSRRGELRRHLGLMRDVARAFRDHPRVTGFILPTVRDQESRLAGAVRSWGVPVVVTADRAEKRDAFSHAVAAAAVSGTVTLELALSGVPMVVTYVGDRGQKRRAEKYKPRFAALPNILFGDPLVPEILDIRPRPDETIAALRALLDAPGAIEAQRAGFARIRAMMETGEPGAPLTDPAERVLGYLRLLRGT